MYVIWTSRPFIDRMGLLGIYIYKTFQASRKRPLYIVSETSGFSQKSQQNYLKVAHY